jgi:uncharacterized membrane protein HdeD (DUF308 family)
MSTGFPFFHSAIAAEAERLRKSWGWLLAWGLVLVVVGTAALLLPLLATVASAQVFGILMLIAAGGHIAAAFSARGWGGVLMTVLCGALYFFAGIVFLERPLLGAAAFTLFLAMMFFAGGVARIAAALIHRFSGWGWTVVSGAISVLLAILIWRDLPESALWVIGTFVGIDLIFSGLGWIILALGLRKLPANP